MPTIWEVDSIPCNCGFHKVIGVVSDGGSTSFFFIGAHGVTETQLTDWVTQHHSAVKELVNLSRKAMGFAEV